MTTTRIEWGVRWPGDHITTRAEGDARYAVNYHRDPANRSRWADEVRLLRRVITISEWEEVEP